MTMMQNVNGTYMSMLQNVNVCKMTILKTESVLLPYLPYPTLPYPNGRLREIDTLCTAILTYPFQINFIPKGILLGLL